MSSPYRVEIRIIDEGTEEEIFPRLKGMESVFKEDDVVFFNEVEYKVEGIKIHLTTVSDGGYTYIPKIVYKVTVSEVV